MRRLALAIGCIAGIGAAPGVVMAHPHIFIDTGIEVIFDAEGRAAALRIRWAYDELFSLMLIEDRGLDPDMDGALTAEELAGLNGFDMDWDPDFPGDTYALQGETPLALGRPSDWTADFRDGKLVSTHLRALETPVDPGRGPLVVQAYDPGFYSAYTIAWDTVLTGREGCTAEVLAPDLSEADEQLKAALAEYGAEVDLEMEFPAIGAAYAEEVRVTCAGGS